MMEAVKQVTVDSKDALVAGVQAYTAGVDSLQEGLTTNCW